MSAIYGVINLKGGKVPTDLPGAFTKYYSNYAIDRQAEAYVQNAWMGCGIQHFYKEHEHEILPILDEEKQFLYTADCVVDNREELIQELGLDSETPDGRVLYESFLKWGNNVGNHVFGAYSMAVYDIANNKVLLLNDHFAHRCLFYNVRDGVLYFSTLFFPIVKETGLRFTHNERWLVDEISLRGPAMMTEERETPVMDVYKVVCGTYVEIDGVSCTPVCKRYYDPIKTYKVNKKITPAMSEKMVRETMKNVVKSYLRDSDKIAATLSSGLDSSSVTCTAATLLEGSGRDIYAYTSVPDSDAGLPDKGYLVYDETKGVMKICEAYPIIKPHFVDSKGRNFLKEADDIINYWELPCKSSQNAIWLDEIYSQMQAAGRKIVLSGATGNCTLSAGNIQSTAIYYLKRLRIKKALGILDAVKIAGGSKKRYVKKILNLFKSYYKGLFEPDVISAYKDNVTRTDIGENYNYSKRYHQKYGHYKPYNTLKDMREVIYFTNANAQIGEIETKQGLKYGLLLRDPMRSDEFMKLCYSLPMECYASSDYDRRLAREGMKGIVPEEIRHDVNHRGRQSGDNTYRTKLAWDEIADKVKASVLSDKALKYMDKEKVIGRFEGIDFNNKEMNEDDVLMITDAYSFSRYLEIVGI